ncbi:hydroxymethylglutaryl-CoA lyase [Alteribacillus bidgolensis]|uniref:Hydroxymethylglutaryl-CoA lyase n=1 Tax=Alteribacillus bidgolensis TaxID=930129 RepID=A0A1G8N1Q1_9BACI|nr:hydroxymethylglutaryl-CoA lyase [Alteribacillus bidgolensis]SDI74179.1 hydroxymethylglutaryl-CoA lyase [Alteribacillus bidgolensis]
MSWPINVTIKEVGPRDGLQNEKKLIPTKVKTDWINQLSQSGLRHIEITSFVHPKWVPALADAKDVVKSIQRKEGVVYTALVPNQKGLEAAIETNVDEIAVFMSATETHNKKNVNKSIDETLPVLRQTAEEAVKANIPVRAYVSTAFFCPYEGRTNSENVRRISESLLEIGAYELSIGDTVGTASPMQVEDTLNHLLKGIPANKLAMHFHDTRGTALSNTLKALEMGIQTFDSSCGGLGGCPYAPGASGNTATEDLLYMLHQMGIKTGVSEEKMVENAMFMENHIGKPLPSKALQAHKGKKAILAKNGENR